VNDLQALRLQIKTQRRNLSISDQTEAALHFCQNLIQSKILDSTHHIGVYLAHAGELNLQPSMTQLWQQNKTLYLPCIHSTQLVFKKYTPTSTLQANRFGILEIIEGESIAAEDLDAALVPLLAFDHAGHRIGMGQGFYDHTFAFRKQSCNTKPLLIGCGYPFQEVDSLTPHAHDIDMDVIITPSTLLFKKKGFL
jgi:5-formyltetrahydrofolate cyclo-ligase